MTVVALLTIFGAIDGDVNLWILIAVLLIGSIQLVCIGILGRYMARVHDQVLGRPLYVVDRVVGAQATKNATATIT